MALGGGVHRCRRPICLADGKNTHPCALFVTGDLDSSDFGQIGNITLTGDKQNAAGGVKRDDGSNYADNDAYDDVVVLNEPYRNRSASWSDHYRRLLPYESARLAALDLGLRSKEEWDEYVSEGKVFHGAYLPNHPDEMYGEEWTSWEEFLGIMRPYDDARHLVMNVLRLRDIDQYDEFVSSDTKRAELLRIPAKPHKVYKNKGWISFGHFFGTAEETLYFRAPETENGK